MPRGQCMVARDFIFCYLFLVTRTRARSLGRRTNNKGGRFLLYRAEDPEATAGEKAFETARAGEQHEWLVNEWFGIPQSSWSREMVASISSGHLIRPSVIWDGVTVLAVLLKKVIHFSCHTLIITKYTYTYMYGHAHVCMHIPTILGSRA